MRNNYGMVHECVHQVRRKSFTFQLVLIRCYQEMLFLLSAR